MVRVHAGPPALPGARPTQASAGGEVGGLAQLARAPALQAGGHRFESDILHKLGDMDFEHKVILARRSPRWILAGGRKGGGSNPIFSTAETIEQ